MALEPTQNYCAMVNRLQSATIIILIICSICMAEYRPSLSKFPLFRKELRLNQWLIFEKEVAINKRIAVELEDAPRMVPLKIRWGSHLIRLS